MFFGILSGLRKINTKTRKTIWQFPSCFLIRIFNRVGPQKKVFGSFRSVFQCFSLRAGRTVHCIYGFPPPRDPGQKSGQKPGQNFWSNAKNSGLMPKISAKNPCCRPRCGPTTCTTNKRETPK